MAGLFIFLLVERSISSSSRGSRLSAAWHGSTWQWKYRYRMKFIPALSSAVLESPLGRSLCHVHITGNIEW